MDNSIISFTEEGVVIWKTPRDFSKDEVNLLTEMCANGILSFTEAVECVRKLR